MYHTLTMDYGVQYTVQYTPVCTFYFFWGGGGTDFYVPYTPLLRIRDVYPGSEFFHPGSEFFSSRIRIKEFKLLEICSGLLIPDPGSVFFTHLGSGSATLVHSLLTVVYSTLQQHTYVLHSHLSTSPLSLKLPSADMRTRTKNHEPIIGRHLYTAHVRVSTELFFF